MTESSSVIGIKRLALDERPERTDLQGRPTLHLEGSARNE